MITIAAKDIFYANVPGFTRRSFSEGELLAKARSLKFLYVNMAAGYFIDNEAVQQQGDKPLTIENFMARFFNYCMCTRIIIEKPKKNRL